MSPSSSSIAASQLHQLIFYNIDNEMPETANFLAGRLHALEPRNPDSSHLLSLSYYRLRRYKAAYDFSQRYGASGRHLGCAYIFALACVELGRNTEGCTALEKARGLWGGKMNWKKHSETTRRHLPDAPAVYTLMAKLWQAHGDLKKAGDCYIEAHKANPFIWDAFEGLCKVGADLKLENMFRPPQEGAGANTSSTTNVTEIYKDEMPPHSHTLTAQANFNQQILTPSADPFNTARAGNELGQFNLPNVKGKSSLGNAPKQPLSEWDTPTATGGSQDDDVAMGGVLLGSEDTLIEPPAAPSRKARPVQHSETLDGPRLPMMRGRSHAVSSSEGQSEQDGRKPSMGGHKRTISGQAPQASSVGSADPSAQPRRSNRLFGQNAPTRATRSTAETTVPLVAVKIDRTVRPAKAATGTKGRTAPTVGRVVSGNRKMLPPDPADKEKEKEKRVPSRAAERNTNAPSMIGVTSATVQKSQAPPASSIPDSQVEHQAMATLLSNLRQLAVGFYATARFDLPRAIHTFTSLPISQQQTPWVLAQLGRAYYEATDYRSAEECFARLLKIQPSRVEDMEVYSTVLWHMKKDAALAFLCHTLRDVDFHAPQTWCAIGNGFSVQREHEQAISAFKRAVQVDDGFAYAWTLMGHEYIANEELDAALASFRKSVAVDRRCFHGWYGLGKAYERQGKLEEAERHYRIAASINPSNSTLLVCIGVVLERLRHKPSALAHYTKALEISPQSALARFKKARVLMHMRHYQEALAELDVLRTLAPDEANVWFLLGKCYKGLGEKGEALKALTTALNLDVKVSGIIRLLV